MLVRHPLYLIQILMFPRHETWLDQLLLMHQPYTHLTPGKLHPLCRALRRLSHVLPENNALDDEYDMIYDATMSKELELQRELLRSLMPNPNGENAT